MATSNCEVISPELLATVASINRNHEVPNELKIGMSEWLESDNDEENSSPNDVFPPAKKRKLTKTLKLRNPRTLGKRCFPRLYPRNNLQFFPSDLCLQTLRKILSGL